MNNPSDHVESPTLISFLTTAYRTERYVAETIESVVAQTRDDWELVVVDNGESDELADIVNRYTGDSRITLVRQENRGYNGGVSAAAAAASGRFFCVLDSDDLLAPDFCERIGSVLDADPGVAAVGCDAQLFSDPDDGLTRQSYFESVGRKRTPGGSLTVADMMSDGVPYYGGVIRRDAWFAAEGYDPQLENVEPDIVLWLRLAAAGHDVRLLPDKLARYRVHQASSSRDPQHVQAFHARLERSYLAVAETTGTAAASSVHKQVRRLRYNHSMEHARTAFVNGDIEAATTAAKQALAQRRTLRAGAVVGALRLFPGVLRRIHPVKQSASAAVDRTRQRLRTGRRR